MTGLRKIVQNSGIYFFSTIIGKSLLFFLGIFLTRYFTTEELGVWSHLFSVVSITTIFASLNSGIFFLTNRFKFDEQKFKEYFSGIHSLLLVTSLLATVIVFLLKDWLLPKGLEVNLGFFLLFVFFVFICGLRQLYDSILQVEKQVGEGVFSQFLHSIFVFFVTVLLVMQIDEKWEYRFYAEVFGVLVNVIVQAVYLRRFFYPNLILNFSEFKEIGGFLSPLAFHFLGFLLITNTDKIMLGHMIGSSEVGIYGTAFLFSAILVILYDSIIKAWQPYFFEKSEVMDDQTKKSVTKFTKFYYLGSVALFLVYTSVIYLIFPSLVGKDFIGARALMPYLCFGALLEGLRKIHVNFFYLHKKTSELGLFGFTAGILNIILNYLMIKNFGIMGCAYASILSYFILYMLTLVRSRKLFK